MLEQSKIPRSSINVTGVYAMWDTVAKLTVSLFALSFSFSLSSCTYRVHTNQPILEKEKKHGINIPNIYVAEIKINKDTKSSNNNTYENQIRKTKKTKQT